MPDSAAAFPYRHAFSKCPHLRRQPPASLHNSVLRCVSVQRLRDRAAVTVESLGPTVPRLAAGTTVFLGFDLRPFGHRTLPQLQHIEHLAQAACFEANPDT